MSNANLIKLWVWPVALALLTASGLISALVSDGWGDAWSWLALGLPVAVTAWFGLRTRSSSSHSR
ncbi:hypothetical protein SNE35_20040 [Paucibacter sp. R3-3]|uniref:DUF4175 domain-containing protein n=1 Tax=Roseateles agri TaxID=3098619 RepID=A0ABU5DKI3_9BURK|nr:hypothetical protein [Paucibacter sp. R3-3]MDY0746813.1 hypothetical protein [Paucibacter sp. R3-3]